MSIIPNTLNKFVTYNYIWTLGIATSAEVANGGYRNKNEFIVRSGGVGDNKRITTADEDNLGINVEYFIDDIYIESLVSPNPFSGITLASKIEFKITEPYSIGLFLQTLAIAAQRAGYNTYLDIPYILSCEFIGYDSESNVSTVEKRTLLVRLVDINFSVDAGGSVYNVSAIPWTHIALTDTVQRIKTDIQINGSDVLGILAGSGIGYGAGQVDPRLAAASNSGKTLTNYLNNLEKADAVRGSRVIANQYEIVFPTDLANNNATNPIGLSSLIQDGFNSLGVTDLGIDDGVWDGRVFKRGSLTIDADKTYHFTAGTKIEKIIEEVILTSQWMTDIEERIQQSVDGYFDWFKIFTKVEILDSNALNSRGEVPKKYTYAVYPYKMHVSSLPNSNLTLNYTKNIENAVKCYNYIYTGRNLDVLDFNIKIDYAFITAVSRDYGAASTEVVFNGKDLAFINPDSAQGVVKYPVGYGAGAVDPSIAMALARQSETLRKVEEERQRNLDTSYLSTHFGGGNIDTTKVRIARNFNSAILNGDADLVEVDLTIWGDPYYLSESDYGNYVARSGGLYGVDGDGNIDYIRNEVDVLLRFSNPIDYKNDILMPSTTTAFTGVYRVATLTSTFSNGEFKQQLKLLRRKNQDDETIQNVSAVMDAAWTGTVPAIKRSATYQPVSLLLRLAETEAEKLYSAVSRLNSVPDTIFPGAQSEITRIETSLAAINTTIGSLRNLETVVQEKTQSLLQNITDIGSLFNSVFGRGSPSAAPTTVNSPIASPNANKNPSAVRIT